jgi:hypothetical protein
MFPKKDSFEGKSLIIFYLLYIRYGGSQAGTFCSLMSMWHQLEFEGCVDVFQLARLYHYSRPGIWRSQVE